MKGPLRPGDAPLPFVEVRGRVFDGTSGAIEARTLLVDASTGRIAENRAGGTASGGMGGGPAIIETSGTIVPGFVDSHLHLMGARKYDLIEWTINPPVLAALRSVPDLRRLVDSGFTSIRDLGSKAGPSLRQAVDEGDILGPRIATSGRSLAETGGDDDLVVLPRDVAARLAYSVYCDGPWECRKAVRSVVREGASLIKLYASGSFIQGTTVRPQLSEEEIKAIVGEAHKMGLRVAAHAYGEETIRLAVEAGADSIEHGIGLTEDLCELMKRRGTFLVPTLSAYLSTRSSAVGAKREAIERHFTKDIALALRSELRIAAGTDYAGIDTEPHGKNAIEMVQLAAAGLSPLEALRAGTTTGSACLDIGPTGTLREGSMADIVILSGRPDLRIEDTLPDHVEHVLLGGIVVK